MPWKNKATVLERLGRIPAEVKAAVDQQLQKEAADLADAVKRAAPVDADPEHGQAAGTLRQSVHVEPGKRELQARVVIDARDEHGHMYAQHVEFGHMNKGGHHVPPRPFAFPTYRARKKGIRRRMAAAARKAAKAAFPG